MLKEKLIQFIEKAKYELICFLKDLKMNKGFTLIELLSAIVIMAIIILIAISVTVE